MLKVEELSIMLIKMSSWESSSEVKRTAKASMCTTMARSTPVPGRMTCNMEKALRPCPMEARIKALSKEAVKEVKECRSGQIIPLILERGRTER
jgi:hypothetical protein